MSAWPVLSAEPLFLNVVQQRVHQCLAPSCFVLSFLSDAALNDIPDPFAEVSGHKAECAQVERFNVHELKSNLLSQLYQRHLEEERNPSVRRQGVR